MKEQLWFGSLSRWTLTWLNLVWLQLRLVWWRQERCMQPQLRQCCRRVLIYAWTFTWGGGVYNIYRRLSVQIKNTVELASEADVLLQVQLCSLSSGTEMVRHFCRSILRDAPPTHINGNWLHIMTVKLLHQSLLFTLHQWNLSSCIRPSVPVKPVKNMEVPVKFHWCLVPRVGSGVVRMDPLCFLAGCRTRRLNQV